jgi:2-amino-4-hydroxy-6-hydroxymethyldihydropteridine diphosphokinase
LIRHITNQQSLVSFVLVPLAEIEPDFKVPVLGSIQALIDKLDTSELIKL